MNNTGFIRLGSPGYWKASLEGARYDLIQSADFSKVSHEIKELTRKKIDVAKGLSTRLSEDDKEKIIWDEIYYIDSRSAGSPEGEFCYALPAVLPIDTVIHGLARRIVLKSGYFCSDLSGLSIPELRDYAINVLGLDSIVKELEFK